MLSVCVVARSMVYHQNNVYLGAFRFCQCHQPWLRKKRKLDWHNEPSYHGYFSNQRRNGVLNHILILVHKPRPLTGPLAQEGGTMRKYPFLVGNLSQFFFLTAISLQFNEILFPPKFFREFFQ